MEKLIRTMPHITYVCLSSAEIKGERAYRFFRDSEVLEYSRACGKITLIGIDDMTCGGFLDHRETVIESIMALAKRGYDGVYLRAPDAERTRRKDFYEFLLELRKRFLGCDLILFCEALGICDKDAVDISDGSDLVSPTDERLGEYAELCESGKTFVRLPTRASVGILSETDIRSALGLAYRTGSEISISECGKSCSFSYNKYKNGEGMTETVSFPSLVSIRKKMALAAELGYMGFSFDISTVPVPYLSMLNSEFARADYSLVSSFEM